MGRLFGWTGPDQGATDYAHVGKSGREIGADLREVAAETRKRTNNRCDTEDQQARTANLREARGRLN